MRLISLEASMLIEIGRFLDATRCNPEVGVGVHSIHLSSDLDRPYDQSTNELFGRVRGFELAVQLLSMH